MLWLEKIFSRVSSIVKEFSKQLSENAVTAFSAQAAFYIMLSIFPFIMLVLTAIQYLPDSEKELNDMIFTFMPWETQDLVKSVMADVQATASSTLISVTALTTLWVASGGVFALMKGINSVYQVPETRSFVRLRAMSIIYTIFFIFFLVVTMEILMLGNSVRIIVGVLILTVFSLVLYMLIPNRRSKVKNEIIGAIISSVGWVGFSYMFSFYIDNFTNYSRFYGSMTAIVLLMLWLYFCMYIMMFGAQVNIFIQQKGRTAIPNQRYSERIL